MLLLFFILFIINLVLLIFVQVVYDNDELSKKDYKWYMLLLFICLLFFIGQIETITTLNN